jgi:hypothetical protein
VKQLLTYESQVVINTISHHETAYTPKYTPAMTRKMKKDQHKTEGVLGIQLRDKWYRISRLGHARD